MKKLFFGNLPSRYPEADLKDRVSKYGKTFEVAVRDDRDGTRSFGFVEFENEDDARDCVKGEDGQEIEGRRIRVEVKSGARGDRDRDDDRRGGGYGGGYGGGGMDRRAPRGRPTRTLFVGNIHPEAREGDLEDAFRRYGRLVGIRMMTNKRGPGGRQLAFVEFDSLADAEDAMEDSNRINVLRDPVRLDYDAGVGGRGGPPRRRSPPRDYRRRSPSRSPPRRRRSPSRTPPRRRSPSRSPPRRRRSPSPSRTPPRRGGRDSVSRSPSR